MNRSESAHDDTVLVVGSGPAGAMAAAQLVGRVFEVTLLDAGLSAPKGLGGASGWQHGLTVEGHALPRERPSRPHARSRHRLAVESIIGRPDELLDCSRTEVRPEDFTEGRHLDERYEWPVSYTDLVPYYEKAEAALVVTAGQPFSNFPENTVRYRCRPPDDWADRRHAPSRPAITWGRCRWRRGAPGWSQPAVPSSTATTASQAPLLSSDLFTLVR